MAVNKIFADIRVIRRCTVTMNNNELIKNITEDKYIDKSSIIKAARTINPDFSEKSIYWLLDQLMDSGLLIRVGRNKYVINKDGRILKQYKYQYSDKMQKIVSALETEFPLINFQAWESIQYNYFVNHQIAHNTLFVEVENQLENSVYEYLKDRFNSNVLLKPDINLYNLYVSDETIIVLNLITEAPANKNNKHGILLEKLLVDMMTNKLITMFVSKSEYTNVFENAFNMYCIDETKLFRYAKRRNADKRIFEYITKNTKVNLITEDNYVRPKYIRNKTHTSSSNE
jgi:hypothetical protein